MKNFGILYCMTTLVVMCGGEKWQWPDVADSASVRIDTKIKFVDERESSRRRENNDRHKQEDSEPLLDEAPFFQATETQGFYNRPPNSGRFPVRVETYQAAYNTQRGQFDPHESNSDGIQYCKCVTSPDCQQRVDSVETCGTGKYLCCYKRLHRQNTVSEFFNEIEDERPMLFPGRESLARPFPPPPTVTNHQPAVLVGPLGPTSIIGPTRDDRGPGSKGVLVGPNGPNGPRLQEPNESAQRGVLVGPGGPTGIIGPTGYGRRQVLVGPGGPTGVIGPRGQGYYGQGYGRQGFGKQAGPGVLVGPGGPTGIIGPGRQILTGPGGPTGVIGPQQSYFGCSRNKKRKNSTSSSTN